jgi:putative DNA primase/helicase
VVAAEPDAGARLSENVVKTITGGEKVTARHLNQGFVEYTPAFKLIVSCNQKLHIRGQDEGIWRRILMVPFTEFIPPGERDRTLRSKLRAEAPGILNWCLDGYRLWRESGLMVPEVVRSATDDYRRDSDPVGQFVAARTVRSATASANASDLYTAFERWCVQNAVEPASKTKFGTRLVELGYEKVKVGTIFYRGVQLLPETSENPSQTAPVA